MIDVGLDDSRSLFFDGHQGRSRDFSRGTHNSQTLLPPPLQQRFHLMLYKR